MYFWKTASLAADIKNNEIQQSDWKNYYLALSLLLTVLIYLSFLSPRADSTLVIIECVGLLVILFWGINATFEANGGDNGKDYIARMSALSLPLTIKYVLFSFLAMFVMSTLTMALGASSLVMDYLFVCVVLFAQAIFFWRLKFHLSVINT